MVNESYDVNEAFRSIEQELISSMMRNLESHKAEETKEGYNWSAWQAEQLKALRQYRQRNKDKYTKEFSLINAQIDGLIKDARKDGQLEQEKKILQAIKSGRLEDKMDSTFEGKFFKTNDRKINSLIKATKKDFKRGETAMLRQADDQYRKIIFNAQMYAASGAGTYEKAVDMATKDFLTRGITSIEYKNGSRHTMEDYSRMCLRTACKRAYFTGEGEMRNSRGQHLVIMIKRGNPCPKCAPWVGKVLIDDVWSGGSREDGDYPLMSEAIAAGLYHPNCLDSHTTYFDDGFDEEYDREHDSDNVGNMKEEYTKEERQQLAEEYNIEQKAGYAKRQQERFERLEEFSLDPENKRMYGARAQEWEEVVNNIKENEESKTEKPFIDITKKVIQKREKKKNIEFLNEIIVNGVTYKVDNKHIILRPKRDELEIAEILAEKLGWKVSIRPNIIYPQNICSADYDIDGELYDLKTPLSNNIHAIYNCIHKKKKQANNFIIEISKSGLTWEEAIEQIENEIYKSKHTNFVNRIVLIEKNSKKIKVYQRK